jgi:hypothetical protein
MEAFSNPGSQLAHHHLPKEQVVGPHLLVFANPLNFKWVYLPPLDEELQEDYYQYHFSLQ